MSRAEWWADLEKKSLAELKSGLESELESELESALKARVVLLLREKALGKQEISTQLGQKAISGPLHKAIRELVAQGWLAMTIPDKPQSRRQKYRLAQSVRIPPES
jgi:ATP-dependent DNA helicase RecG